MGRQFLLFAALGAIGTGVHYAVLITLVHSGLTSPQSATTFGFAAGALVNYSLNYHVTFRSRNPHREALPKFLAIAVIGGTLNYALMSFGVQIIRIHYLPVQFVATAVVLGWNYYINRIWTFRERGADGRS